MDPPDPPGDPAPPVDEDGEWRSALTTNACGRSAWCKQPRGIWSVLGVLRLASGRLERPNNRGLWRQWRQTAGCNAQARGIWSVLGFLRLANGRLERPNNRGLWRKQPRGIWLQRSNNKCLCPECLVQAAARDLEHFRGFRGFRGFTAGKRQAWTP